MKNIAAGFMLLFSMASFAQTASCDLTVGTDAPTSSSESVSVKMNGTEKVTIDNVAFEVSVGPTALYVKADKANETDFRQRVLFNGILGLGTNLLTIPTGHGRYIAISCQTSEETSPATESGSAEDGI